MGEYVTACGALPKVGFTEAKAWAAVKKDAEAQEAVLGVEKEL